LHSLGKILEDPATILEVLAKIYKVLARSSRILVQNLVKILKDFKGS